MEIALDVDADLRAEVDRYALLQAFGNLLENAVEAYPPETSSLAVRVAASARREGSEIVLSVSDDGVGIA